jgi:hypothetical protein
MTDRTPIPPRDVSPEGPSHNRRIPPLVWIVLGLLVIALGIGAVGGFGMNHAEQAKSAPAASPP